MSLGMENSDDEEEEDGEDKHFSIHEAREADDSDNE